MFLFLRASRLSTRTLGKPATTSDVSFAIDGSTSTVTTVAPRLAMSMVKAPVPDPTSRITSFEPTSAAFTIKS